MLLGTAGYLQVERISLGDDEMHAKAFAKLGAVALDNKFRGLVDLGAIFAEKPQFRELVAGKRWDDAISIANSLTETKLNNFIDRILLFTPDGTLMSQSPDLGNGNLVGKNFAYRDYYAGVSKDWKPYVSEIFKRAPYPQYDTVVIAIPVLDPFATASNMRLTGILGLSIIVDRFLARLNGIKIGDGEIMYFVDQRGRVAMHPAKPTGTSFATVPVVQKVLNGESGAQIFTDPVNGKRTFDAYEPVADYGWGVVVERE